MVHTHTHTHTNNKTQQQQNRQRRHVGQGVFQADVFGGDFGKGLPHPPQQRWLPQPVLAWPHTSHPPPSGHSASHSSAQSQDPTGQSLPGTGPGRARPIWARTRQQDQAGTELGRGCLDKHQADGAGQRLPALHTDSSMISNAGE